MFYEAYNTMPNHRDGAATEFANARALVCDGLGLCNAIISNTTCCREPKRIVAKQVVRLSDVSIQVHVCIRLSL